MTKQEIKKVLEGEGTKSAKMKALYNGGVEIGEIQAAVPQQVLRHAQQAAGMAAFRIQAALGKHSPPESAPARQGRAAATRGRLQGQNQVAIHWRTSRAMSL